MYITKVVLENIRCFKELIIDFSDIGESILLAADNGEGKTTILRSISMGLCDESSAAGLLRELPGALVKKQYDNGKILIHLKSDSGKCYIIKTIIESLPAFERVKQYLYEYKNEKEIGIEQDKFPWEDIFVCGYGAGRQTQGTADLEEYTAVDAVYTLFRYNEPLQNSELAIRRLIEKARESAGEDSARKEVRGKNMLVRIRKLLENILNLDPKDEVIITSTGIEVKGHWGRTKFGSLGDGYKATITWVMDFLSWRMLSRKSLNPKKLSGIIIIDEIEQHLHPRWQLNIMTLLHEAFPKIQFIATTHSPLTASGCSFCKVHTIARGKHKVSNVYGWIAEDVYSEIMGLSNSRVRDVNKIIEEFQDLHFKKIKKEISTQELKRLKTIETELKEYGLRDTQLLKTQLLNINKFLKLAKRDN